MNRSCQFLVFLEILSQLFANQNYILDFEYLLSDEKDEFNIELFNEPKNFLYDYGANIYYSGKLETIEKFPVSKLINFNKSEFMGQIRKKEVEDLYENKKTRIETNKETKQEKKEKYEKKEENKKNENDLNKENFRNDNLEIFQDIIEDPFIEMFFNDYNNFQNKIRYRKNNKPQKQSNYYKNNYYNNYYDNYYQYKNSNEEKNNHNYNTNIQIIHHHNNNENSPTIKVIKYPKNNLYYKDNNYNNNKNNYNLIYNFDDIDHTDPFSIFDDFNFESFDSNFDFFDSYIDESFNKLERQLNKLYGIRLLSEKNTKKKLNTNFISKQKHNLIFIQNKLYLDYIKYLPKSTIILIPKQYIQQIRNYEDYYIFTVEEKISLINAISKTEKLNYFVKIGQKYTDTNFIFISILLTIILCFMGSIIYSFLLKNTEASDILPVQKLTSKFPIFLCLLNFFIYICFIYSYNEFDGYYIIIKYISLFLYSLFRSIFLSLLILLLNGWMILYFIGWAEKLNKIIPILIYEIISSISFELLDFYNFIPYNKLQLYYFRNIIENIVISSISFISLYKYYFPLNQKCKYLSIINSDFHDAYKLKKRKMISFIVFGIFYAFISIYSNYLEFPFIYKYIQNDSLHIIKQIIFESIFNFIFTIILLPMELPYLFTEETDLLSFGYFFINLKNEIMDINNKNVQQIKYEAEDNIPIIVVNPFYDSKNGFENLYTGNIKIENNSNNE